MRISYNRALWTGPENEVLVWTFNLDEIDSDAVASVLSPDERDRAARFRFGIHRDRYIAGRGAIRYTLGEVLGVSPDQLKFSYGAHGKPELAECGASFSLRGALAPHEKLFFNLSHSENQAILAITRAAPLGVDVEKINPDRSNPDIARRFFAAQEIAELARLQGPAYSDAFFQLWARKEAVLKAIGTGIAGGLSSFAVPLDPMPAPVHIPSPDCWIGNLAHAFPYLQSEGFSSAVALLAQQPLIRPVCDRVSRIPVRRTFK